MQSQDGGFSVPESEQFDVHVMPVQVCVFWGLDLLVEDSVLRNEGAL